jgi:hypothetical protein
MVRRPSLFRTGLTVGTGALAVVRRVNEPSGPGITREDYSAKTPASSSMRNRPMAQPVTVVIAGDQRLARQGLRLILESEPGIQVQAETSDTAEAHACRRAHHAPPSPARTSGPQHSELALIGMICEASAPGCPPQQSVRRPRRRHQMLLDAAPAPGAEPDQLSAAQKRSARSGLAEVVTFGYISWLRPTPAERLSLGAPSSSRCPSHSCAHNR